MADLLKKGIGPGYLLPIIGIYTSGAALLGIDEIGAVKSVLLHAGLASISGLVLIAFQEILPRAAKEALIFWRLKERVPGYRAFSQIAVRDGRVDPVDLAVLLPAGTMTPVEENALWYRWLKAVESDPAIADNHRRLLILRECAVLLLLLAAVSPFVALLPEHSVRGAGLLTLSCVAAYLVAMATARQAAERLVGNVIALKVATS